MIQRSRDEMGAVENLIDAGHSRIAISRSYYIAFYSATALVLNMGEEFSKHSALLAAFGKEFGKIGETEQRMHKIFLNLFDLRHDTDYNLSVVPSKEEAIKYQQRAVEFLEWAKTQLPDID